MELRIEIVSDEIKEMKGVSKKSGNAYDMAMQDAYLHKGERYPEKLELGLQRDPLTKQWERYAPGFYTLDASSFQVRDGRLGINSYEMKLVPVVEAVAKARAA